MFNLGFHGSHNATLALSYGDKILEAVELERFISHKNAALYYYENPPHAVNLVKEIDRYFKNKYQVEKYDYVIYNSVDENLFNFDKILNYNKLEYCPHHIAHCCSAFYQSPYPEALVISFDGGSDEGFFNIYTIKRGKDPQKVYSGEMDYAVSYMVSGHFIPAIKREEDVYKGNLVYPGKLMGYVGYGKYRDDLAEKLISFYKSNTYDNIVDAFDRYVTLFAEYGITDWNSYFSEQDSKDIATTNQIVFETLFESEVSKFLEIYSELPVVLTGGCALNIINNTKISKTREVFIPPNPSDVGLAIGCLCSIINPNEPVDTTYIGPQVWDRMELGKYLYERSAEEFTISKIANIITSGGIIGVVRDRCEHGPRALGNRSLICDATNPKMKDFVNSNIKNRESFRPFSPIVRYEDLNKYFKWHKESKHMTYSPEVREEYRETLKSAVHIDGTARVQTVTREQNSFIYDLLTELNNKTGYGVILNTSFNVDGKPILNTYKEAFEVLDKKPITGLILEDFYFPKPVSE